MRCRPAVLALGLVIAATMLFAPLAVQALGLTVPQSVLERLDEVIQ